MVWFESMGPVMRSGAAAKLKVERIRMQRMRVACLDVERLGEDSKGDDEGCIVTPWRNRMVTGPEALPLLLLSPGMSKIFLVGLYELTTVSWILLTRI